MQKITKLLILATPLLDVIGWKCSGEVTDEILESTILINVYSTNMASKWLLEHTLQC